MVEKVFTPPRKIIPINDDRKRINKISSSMGRPRYIHMLLSGLSGQGKTTIAGTASKRALFEDKWTQDYNNIFAFPFDTDGLDTLTSMGVEADRPSRMPETESEIISYLEFLSSEEANQYDVVLIDNYNELQDIVIKSILKDQIQATQSRNRQTPHDPDTLELKDYGKLYRRCKRINNLLLSLDKHIIVTCIAQNKPHPIDANAEILSLALEGKMAHVLSAAFSIHGLILKEGSGTNLKVNMKLSEYNTEAKTRFKMPSILVDPTFPGILKAIGIIDRSFDKIKWKKNEQGLYVDSVITLNGN